MVAVGHRPGVAEAGDERVWFCIRLVGADENIVGRDIVAADAGFGPVGGAQADPGAGRGPGVADERAFDRGVERPGEGHARAAGYGGEHGVRILPARERRRRRAADRGERGVRMHVEHRERKREREARGDFVGDGERAQHFLDRAPLRFGFGEQRRDGVRAAVAGSVAETFVELAPGDRHAVRARRGVAVGARRAFGEHRRFGLAGGSAQQAFARSRDLRLQRPRHHRADVVGEDDRRAPAHRLGQRLRHGFGRPLDQLDGVGGGLRARRIFIVCHVGES